MTNRPDGCRNDVEVYRWMILLPRRRVGTRSLRIQHRCSNLKSECRPTPQSESARSGTEHDTSAGTTDHGDALGGEAFGLASSSARPGLI